MRDYTKIEAWKLADDLTVTIYTQTHGFPREELYGLTTQLRRAASSVPANIVEGSARGTLRDFLHFLHIARASLSETQYFVRLGYLNETDALRLRPQIKQVFACLRGLIQAVSSEANHPESGNTRRPQSRVVPSTTVRNPAPTQSRRL